METGIDKKGSKSTERKVCTWIVTQASVDAPSLTRTARWLQSSRMRARRPNPKRAPRRIPRAYANPPVLYPAQNPYSAAADLQPSKLKSGRFNPLQRYEPISSLPIICRASIPIEGTVQQGARQYRYPSLTDFFHSWGGLQTCLEVLGSEQGPLPVV